MPCFRNEALAASLTKERLYVAASAAKNAGSNVLDGVFFHWGDHSGRGFRFQSHKDFEKVNV